MDIYCPCQAAVHSSQSWTTNLSSLISAPGLSATFLSPFLFPFSGEHGPCQDSWAFLLLFCEITVGVCARLVELVSWGSQVGKSADSLWAGNVSVGGWNRCREIYRSLSALSSAKTKHFVLNTARWKGDNVCKPQTLTPTSMGAHFDNVPFFFPLCLCERDGGKSGQDVPGTGLRCKDLREKPF